jgi:hypothetical protein
MGLLFTDPLPCWRSAGGATRAASKDEPRTEDDSRVVRGREDGTTLGCEAGVVEAILELWLFTKIGSGKGLERA